MTIQFARLSNTLVVDSDFNDNYTSCYHLSDKYAAELSFDLVDYNYVNRQAKFTSSEVVSVEKLIDLINDLRDIGSSVGFSDDNQIEKFVDFIESHDVSKILVVAADTEYKQLIAVGCGDDDRATVLTDPTDKLRQLV
jgi:hypothetical protein